MAEPGFETWVFPLPSHKKIESIGLKYLGSKAERLFFLLFWARLSGNAIQNVVLYIYTYKYILIYTLRCPKIVGYSQEYKGIPLNPPMMIIIYQSPVVLQLYSFFRKGSCIRNVVVRPNVGGLGLWAENRRPGCYMVHAAHPTSLG